MNHATPLQIGQVIRDAHVFNVQRWQDLTMNTDALLQMVDDLFALLDRRQIDYVLVGGIALLAYVEGRNTEDIDLIMALESLRRLPEIEIVEQDRYFVRGRYQELQIDCLLTDNPLFAAVQRRHAARQTFAERTISTATVEGLLLLKLYALPSLYRQGNFARVGLYENDIAILLYAYEPDLHALLEQLTPYVSAADKEELSSIAADIERRIARFRQHPDS